jgi:hypothetical protein
MGNTLAPFIFAWDGSDRTGAGPPQGFRESMRPLANIMPALVLGWPDLLRCQQTPWIQGRTCSLPVIVLTVCLHLS